MGQYGNKIIVIVSMSVLAVSALVFSALNGYGTILAFFSGLAVGLAFYLFSKKSLKCKRNDEITENYQIFSKYENIIDMSSESLKFFESNEEQYFNFLLDELFKLIPEAERGSVSEIKGNYIRYISVKGHDKKALNSLNINKKHMYVADEPFIFVGDNSEETEEYYSKKYSYAVKPYKVRLYKSIYIDGKPIGNISLDIPVESDKMFSVQAYRYIMKVSQIASNYLSFHKYYKAKQNIRDHIIDTLINVLELYDPYTKGHSNNVATLSVKIAKKMGLKKDEIEKVYLTGLLHDIGKILVPQIILNKPGRLTDEEFKEIKKHPKTGYELLKKYHALEDIAKYILHHHERYDGRGYPDNLHGEEINIVSRIISVADAYDAMISLRVYKSPFTKDDAVREIQNRSGSQFDPKVVKCLLECI